MLNRHVLLLSAALLGCAGAQLSTARVSEVGATARAAEELGANNLPKASLHLQLAREEMAEAKRLASEGEEEDAALLLERASADADLALQLTKTEHEQAKAKAAWQKTQGQTGTSPQ
jgi:hypothetical protein